MFRRFVVSTALVFGATSNALAADFLDLGPAQYTDWSGFYVGVHAGVVDTATTIRDESRQLFDNEGATLYTNDMTGLVGLHGGFNWHLGNQIIGIEADYSWTDAGRSRVFNGTDHIAKSQLDGYGSLRGRTGLVHDNSHIYVTAGIGFVDAFVFGTEGDPDDVAQHEDFFAFVAGVGTEVKLRSDVSGRLEFLHYQLGDETEVCAVCVGRGQQIFGGSINDFRAGLTWHLNQESSEIDLSGNNNVWSGFYVGGHVGALDSATRLQDEDQTITTNEGTSIFTNSLDFAGGIHAGYNHAFGSAVVGLEADYTFTDSGFSRFYDGGDQFLSSQIDGLASLRGRLGVAAGNAHAYVTGGAALINGEIVAADAEAGTPDERVEFDHLPALVVGAGAEAKLSPQVSLRGEYLLYMFDEQAIICGACTAPIDEVLADGEIHTFRLGLTYHPNGDAVEMETVHVADWSGLYGGVHATFISSRTGIRDEDGLIFAQPGTTVFTTSQDAGGGIYGGYNHQWGNAVAGVEVDYTFTDAGQSRFFDFSGDESHFASGEIDGFGSVRGRLGLAVGDSLFFATGGIGFVDVEMAGAGNDPVNAVQFDGFTALVAGVGTEFKMSDNIAVRAEYQYYGFDEQVDRCGACTDGAQYADGELHIFRGGVSFLMN